jgi:hypothetical protein
MPDLTCLCKLLAPQNAGTVVVEAKAGKGSATLSMAYAAARMAESTLLGLTGEPNIYECAFVQSDVSAATRAQQQLPTISQPCLANCRWCLACHSLPQRWGVKPYSEPCG